MSFKTKAIPSQKPEIKTVKRPWGSFWMYAHNKEVTVSLAMIKPNQRLSKQSHEARAELWIILDDGSEVILGEKTLYPKAGDEIWIPDETIHRISSTGPEVRFLEVAFGNWQQEDITRFDDDYDRPEIGE